MDLMADGAGATLSSSAALLKLFRRGGLQTRAQRAQMTVRLHEKF